MIAQQHHDQLTGELAAPMPSQRFSSASAHIHRPGIEMPSPLYGRGSMRFGEKNANRAGSDLRGNQGPASHIPVLLDEVINALQPKPGSRIVDGTFGAGGYSRAFLQAGASVLALDCDPHVAEAGAALQKEYGKRFLLVQARYAEFYRHLGFFCPEMPLGAESSLPPAAQLPSPACLDGIALDLGVSSMQLDQAERGFSFMRNGPLDMRMASAGISAYDAVNQLNEMDLADIFFLLADERQSRKIARAIIRKRQSKPIDSTVELAEIIAGAYPKSANRRIHPATRTFQALRIFVNGELQDLANILLRAAVCLRPEGRLAVVSFHSIEARIIKRFLRALCRKRAPTSRHLPAPEPEEPIFQLLTDQEIQPDDQELAENVRSRSARLRVAQRNSAPAILREDLLDEIFPDHKRLAQIYAKLEARHAPRG